MRHAAPMQNAGEVAAARAAQARAAAEGAREQAQAAREAAQAQREAAEEASNVGQVADALRGGGQVVVVTKDGKTITLDGGSPDLLSQLGVAPQPVFPEPDPGPYIMGGIGMIATAVVLIVGLTQRYRIKMRGAAGQALPADLAQRLTRMESGIEAVAVEVERISEGQRFTTRLLSDRAPQEVPRG